MNAAPSGISTVLFDLDDTLTAASRFGATVLARAAAEHGHDLAIEVIEGYPGVRFEPLLVRLLHVEPPAAAAIYATYVRRYGEMMPGGLRERPGAGALLRALAARGVRMGLVTNKLEALAREIVEMLGWTELLPVIVGQDSSAFRKPDPRVVRHALGQLDARADRAALVGDTEDDMRGASGARIATVVGVLGTTPGERLTAAGATHLCAELDEVLAVVTG